MGRPLRTQQTNPVVTAKNLEKSWLELVKRRLPREISELLAR